MKGFIRRQALSGLNVGKLGHWHLRSRLLRESLLDLVLIMRTITRPMSRAMVRRWRRFSLALPPETVTNVGSHPRQDARLWLVSIRVAAVRATVRGRWWTPDSLTPSRMLATPRGSTPDENVYFFSSASLYSNHVGSRGTGEEHGTASTFTTEPRSIAARRA